MANARAMAASALDTIGSRLSLCFSLDSCHPKICFLLLHCPAIKFPQRLFPFKPSL
jgi:hypothetical protein